jgi:hypothetical protein
MRSVLRNSSCPDGDPVFASYHRTGLYRAKSVAPERAQARVGRRSRKRDSSSPPNPHSRPLSSSHDVHFLFAPALPLHPPRPLPLKYFGAPRALPVPPLFAAPLPLLPLPALVGPRPLPFPPLSPASSSSSSSSTRSHPACFPASPSPLSAPRLQ